MGVSVVLVLSDDLLTEAAGELNGPVLGFVEADFTDGEVDCSVDICCTGGSRRDCSFDDNFLGAETLDGVPFGNSFDDIFLRTEGLDDSLLDDLSDSCGLEVGTLDDCSFEILSDGREARARSLTTCSLDNLYLVRGTFSGFGVDLDRVLGPEPVLAPDSLSLTCPFQLFMS